MKGQPWYDSSIRQYIRASINNHSYDETVLTLAVKQKIRLNVPGVTWASSGAAAGSSASLVKGVLSAEENFNNNTLTIVFDDAVVSVEEIKEALKAEGFPVSGPPEYVEGQK